MHQTGEENTMFSLGIRDHVMIAHSLEGEVFGPARNLHGATYVVDVEFRRPSLDDDGLVVDIGQASTLVREVLAPLNYQNLDEMPEFDGQNTTTEFLAREIFSRLKAKIGEGALGASGRGLTGLKVTLHESHVAWAAHEGPLP